MRKPRAEPLETLPMLPPLPGWIVSAPSEPPEAAAFRSGAALAHLDFSSAFVWVPCLTWAILLVNAAYAIPMGVRYRVGPNQPGDIIGAKIGASLWLAGTAALLWFHAFTPQPFIVERVAVRLLNLVFSPFLLWPDDPAAAHFVVTWLYLGVILRHAAKLAVRLRGEGGAGYLYVTH